MDACRPQVADDGGLLVKATPEQAQDAPLKLFLHCPAKRQPEPPFAVVAQGACPQVWAGLFKAFLMGLVNQ
jgi:hypothetical protein